MNTRESRAPHVLVIDDDEAVRGLLSELLADEGFRVSAHHTAIDDPNLLADMAPDLILLDIVLGDHDGLAFLTQLKGDHRTAAIPVLVCTAASHLAAEIDARLTAGDCQPVTKPFDLDALLDEIRGCVGHPRSAST